MKIGASVKMQTTRKEDAFGDMNLLGRVEWNELIEEVFCPLGQRSH